MKVDDPDLADLLFLDRHPAWTWADLMATPDHIVKGLQILDEKRAVTP